MSRSGWLTYSGRFTHICGHPSVAGRAQDRESSPVKDRRSTTVPRNQHHTQRSGRDLFAPPHPHLLRSFWSPFAIMQPRIVFLLQYIRLTVTA